MASADGGKALEIPLKFSDALHGCMIHEHVRMSKRPFWMQSVMSMIDSWCCSHFLLCIVVGCRRLGEAFFILWQSLHYSLVKVLFRSQMQNCVSNICRIWNNQLPTQTSFDRRITFFRTIKQLLFASMFIPESSVYNFPFCWTDWVWLHERLQLGWSYSYNSNIVSHPC